MADNQSRADLVDATSHMHRMASEINETVASTREMIEGSHSLMREADRLLERKGLITSRNSDEKN